MKPHLVCVAALVAAVVACTDSAATAPRFQDDVMPILAANCVRCHSVPTIGGAPGQSACTTTPGVKWCGFRLDSYDDTIIANGDPATPDDDVGVRGAAAIALAIPLRVASSDAPMPPRFPLDENERATLVTWAQSDPPDRTPRPGNQPPTIAATAIATAAAVELRYTIADGDRDLVVGAVLARGVGGERVLAAVKSGTDALTVTRPPAGSYALVAQLDDGAGQIEIAVGSLEVLP